MVVRRFRDGKNGMVGRDTDYDGFDVVVATKFNDEVATGKLMYREHRKCGNRPLYKDGEPYCPVCDCE